MDKIFPIRLDKEGFLALSRAYLNKNDKASLFFDKVKQLDDYEDVFIHADESGFIYESTSDTEIIFSSSDLAEIIKTDKAISKGANIRLLSCGSGRTPNGLAQQLANELRVNVLAPTEVLWIREDGSLFVSDSYVLADMWNNHEDVNETGRWELFYPDEKEV